MISDRYRPAAEPAPHAAPPTRHVGERLAAAMVEMAENGEIVDAEALCLRGFTRAEIDRHGADAADRATAIRRGEPEAA